MSECRHGLDTAWCASCKNPLVPSRRPAHEIGPTFVAAYEGWCRICRDTIKVAERINAYDDGYAHTGCVPA